MCMLLSVGFKNCIPISHDLHSAVPALIVSVLLLLFCTEVFLSGVLDQTSIRKVTLLEHFIVVTFCSYHIKKLYL